MTNEGLSDCYLNKDQIQQKYAVDRNYENAGKTPASAVDTEMTMLADAYKGLNDALSELERRLAPVLVPEGPPNAVGVEGQLGNLGAVNPAMQSPLQGKIASRRAEAERVTRKVKKILGSLAI